MKKISMKQVLGLIDDSNQEGSMATALKENFILFIKGERSLLSVFQINGKQKILKKDFLFEKVTCIERVFAVRNKKDINLIIVATLDNETTECFCLGYKKVKNNEDETNSDSSPIEEVDSELATGYFSVLEKIYEIDGIAEYTVQEIKEQKAHYSFSTLYTKKYNKYLENKLRLLIAFSGLPVDTIMQCSYVIDDNNSKQLEPSVLELNPLQEEKNED